MVLLFFILGVYNGLAPASLVQTTIKYVASKGKSLSQEMNVCIKATEVFNMEFKNG